MLSRRRDRGVGERWDDHVDIRTPREVSVFRIIVGALHVLDRWRNRNRAAQMCARSGDALEVGKRIQSHVDFARGAAKLVTVDVFEKIAGKIPGLDELRKRQSRIDARRNYIRVNLIPVGEHYALRFAILDDDLRNP